MNRSAFLIVTLLSAFFTVSVHADEGGDRYDRKRSNRRLDCRFYGSEHLEADNPRSDRPKFCYASATYLVLEDDILNIRYGVGCDRQTIFDERGIIEPEELVADHIRPRTAATPLVELKESKDLRNPGSYAAKLEVEEGILLDGHCYVVDTSHGGDDSDGDGPFFD